MAEFKTLDLDALLQDLRNRKCYHHVWWWIRYGVWQWLESRPRTFRWLIQRGKRGWADVDAWNFHAYLPKVIYEAVAYLQEVNHGYPGSLDYEEDEENHDWKESRFQKWHEILGDIVFAFQAAQQIAEDDWFSPSAGWAQSDEGWTEAWYDKWSKRAREREEKFELPCRAMTKEEVERYERGWELFKKFFFHLWD